MNEVGKKGFTLLELVVVVAIIGILSATVLIPNLLRFRDKGAAARAKADVQALAGAVELSAVEGCSQNIFIKSGGEFSCGDQVYIKTVPSPPGGQLQYRYEKGPVDGNLGGQDGGVTINPQVPDFKFYVRGFKNDANAKFICEKGSCWCSSDQGISGCEQ